MYPTDSKQSGAYLPWRPDLKRRRYKKLWQFQLFHLKAKSWKDVLGFVCMETFPRFPLSGRKLLHQRPWKGLATHWDNDLQLSVLQWLSAGQPIMAPKEPLKPTKSMSSPMCGDLELWIRPLNPSPPSEYLQDPFLPGETLSESLWSWEIFVKLCSDTVKHHQMKTWHAAAMALRSPSARLGGQNHRGTTPTWRRGVHFFLGGYEVTARTPTFPVL